LFLIHMQTRLFIAILIFSMASVALAQEAGAPTDVSKIAAMLKHLDKNGNGIIEQDEADNGAGPYLERRVFGPAKVQPHYPITISELLQIAGGQAPSGSTSTAPATAPTTGPAAAAPAASAAPAQPSATATAPAPTAGTTSATTPAPAAVPTSPSTSAPAGTQITTSLSPAEIRPPVKKSGAWSSAKDRLPKGLPSWFLSKADADGQILMSEYTDRWTPEALAEFQKYDLNHDGIITADEVLKVERPRGRR
jgi:hypothetical protein